jgi:ABC-2 type transport system permease protein
VKLPVQWAAVRAIALRGLRNYFESPTAYVILFVFYLLTGYLFALPFFLVGQASVKGLMDFVPLILTFLVPGLSMGLLADELKSGTFESLATLPIEDWDIALGKFCGYALFLLAAVAGLAFFAVAAAFLAAKPFAIDWGEALGVLSALYCLGFMYGAIGLFASSLTRNQIVAFVGAFMMGFFFFALGKIAGFFPGALMEFAESAGVDSHLANMARGVFDTRDLLYFGSVAFIFLYLAAQRLRTRRFS